jgi:hypothetical protein
MIPDLVEELKPTLIPEVTKVIIDLPNEKLDGITLQDIMDLINNGGVKRV